MRHPLFQAVVIALAPHVASAFAVKGRRESEHDYGSMAVRRVSIGPPENTSTIELYPVAWLHVPKCGESLFNAIVHLPGACPAVPEDFAVTVESVHNELTLDGFFAMFGQPQVSCPGALNL